MSTGDWFTLNPLNLKNYQTEIDQINTRLDDLANKVDAFEFLMNNMQDQVDAIGTLVNNMGTQLTNLNNNVNGMTTQLTNLNNTANNLGNTVNSMSSSINNIVNLYEPIAWFNTPNVRFTDLAGDTATGSIDGAWYQPIKLLPGQNNDGVDLKFLILVLRAINISPLQTNVNYNSDPIPLPIPFVNNNTYGVFWSSSTTGAREMITAQAKYALYNVPISFWALNVVPVGTSINNDSAFFIVGYI
jgi:archaellum component FlaC